MAEIFPAALQDKFNEASFSYGIGDASIESQTDVGTPKKRARYTTGIDTVTGTIDLEIDDWTTLETFFKTTLAFGVKTFDYNHPLTQVPTEYRFKSPPTLSPIGGRWFRVSFSWIEIP